jgi:hypothetical protein
VARGYRGDARTVSAVRVRIVDAEFALACVAGAVAAIGIDRALGG